MQNVINYEDFFQFKLCVPIIKFDNCSFEQFEQFLYNEGVIPISYIRNEDHIIYQNSKNQVTPILQDRMVAVALSVYYTKNYLA